MQSLESLQRWTLKQSGLLESQRSSGIITGFWISVSMVMISTFGRLLLDCVSDELLAASTELEESSNGAMSPESIIGSSKELLTGVTDELLALSEDVGVETWGTPEDIGGSKELLLSFVAADDSASRDELLRRSWLDLMSV